MIHVWNFEYGAIFDFVICLRWLSYYLSNGNGLVSGQWHVTALVGYISIRIWIRAAEMELTMVHFREKSHTNRLILWKARICNDFLGFLFWRKAKETLARLIKISHRFTSIESSLCHSKLHLRLIYVLRSSSFPLFIFAGCHSISARNGV